MSTHKILRSGLTPPALPYVCTVNHLVSGGVLDASWSFSSNIPFQRELPPLPPSALVQVICRTVRCPKSRSCPPPGRTEGRSEESVHLLPGGTVDCCGLMPLDRVNRQVLCPSVFSKTGWVTRALSIEDLFRVFDVPPGAVPHPPARGEDPIWQRQPPIKVLHRVFQMWTSMPSIQLHREKVPQSRPFVPESMYSESNEHDLEAAFISAIKSDEAEIPVFLWNDRIWALGIHNESSVKAFQLKWNERCPLDFIRDFLLRHWRQRVRRSLIRYLVD